MPTNGLGENLRFLILEVTQQLYRARRFLLNPTTALHESAFNKEEYINHLKGVVQRKCFEALQDDADQATVAELKAIDVCAMNLERIADYCKNLMDQARGLDDEDVLEEEDFLPLFSAVETGLAYVEEALFNKDTQAALKICETEWELDNLYRKVFSKLLEELEDSEKTRDLIGSMFIYRYLERMGDSLLNVGQAIVSLSVGESIKVSRLRALEEVIDLEDLEEGDAELERVADTRSGNKISRLKVSGGEQAGMMMIVKGGRLKKVLNEKASYERWEAISPGLVPKVHSSSTDGDHGTLLVEYLPGRTLQQVILQGEEGEVARALDDLCGTLERLWKKTREPTPVSARFVKQIQKRLEAVTAVHPGFAEPDRRIGGCTVRGLESLLTGAAKLEKKNKAPFSVYIHGDLNLDNVIMQPGAEIPVHFIDLHRSRMMDYVQDVSVFMVSNLRLQVFDVPLRRRLGAVALRFCEFGRQFAADSGDETFETRLGLGLARSFFTSTRFILDPDLANWHFLRARYLLERLNKNQNGTPFRIPSELLLD